MDKRPPFGQIAEIALISVQKNVYMFQLSKEEFLFWKSQIVTSEVDRKGLRRPPYAFTEQGVAMLRSQGVRSQGISVILEGPQREFFAVGQSGS